MEIISVGKQLLCLMKPPVNQLLIPPWLWLWLWVGMTLSVVTPSSAARARFYPSADESSGSNAVAAAAAGSWWSSASLAAGVLLLALAAVVGVIYFFSGMQERTQRGTLYRILGSMQPSTSTSTSTAHRRGTERPAAGTKRTQTSQKNSRQYAYEHDELDKATNRFVHMVGEGRAGKVYRGNLMSNEANSIGVAVKRFHSTLVSDLAVEAVKYRVKNLVENRPHQNIVRVHGAFSKVGRKLYVVYDLMPEGSLHQHLFVRKASLNMDRRTSIVQDVARGLQYLHSHGILHGSVRASNILLEDNLKNARIGDFDFFLHDQPRCKGHPSNGAGGSRSAEEAVVYMPPECRGSNRRPITEATYEMDVFCFGVIVLEVISGRQANHNSRFIVDVVRDLHRSSRILDVVVDRKILEGVTADGCHSNWNEAERLLLVGLECCHNDPSKRPKMSKVVEKIRPPEVPPGWTVRRY